MDFVYRKMSEAEMDLAIVDSILREKKVADLFFQEAGFSGEIIKVYHSLTEQQSDGTMENPTLFFSFETKAVL